MTTLYGTLDLEHAWIDSKNEGDKAPSLLFEPLSIIFLFPFLLNYLWD